MLYFTLYNGYVSEQYHADYINNLFFDNSRIHSKTCQQPRTAPVEMSHNARRLGEVADWGRFSPEYPQAVKGSSRHRFSHRPPFR